MSTDATITSFHFRHKAIWALISFFVLSANTIAQPSETQSRLTQLQRLATPLQESSEKILQMHMERNQMITTTRDNSSTTDLKAKGILNEANHFFYLVDQLQGEAMDVVSPQKISHCLSTLEGVEASLVSPLREKIRSSATLSGNDGNEFAAGFYAAARRLGMTLLSETCF